MIPNTHLRGARDGSAPVRRVGKSPPERVPLVSPPQVVMHNQATTPLKEVIRLGQATQSGFWSTNNQKAAAAEAKRAEDKRIKEEAAKLAAQKKR